MSEYLAPGVYVEEVARGPRPVEGIDPSVTALVGTGAEGPFDEPVLVTGDSPFGEGSWLSQAVADFLTSGGERVHAVRASTPAAGLAALEGHGVRLLVVEQDLAAAYAWGAEHHAFLLADAEPGGVMPEGLGRDAAVYWPPLADRSGATRPCSPAVAGVMVRSDRERGVWKSASGLDATVAAVLAEEPSRDDVDELVQRGVNVLRVLDGRVVVWGARTAAWQDPEWRYVCVRRTVMMIEQSLERGLRWVTFEPNGPALWAQVRFQVETFLIGLWREGALFGPKPEHGFFVRCGPTTTTSEDLAAGFLVCEVGLALLRPAEFTVLRFRLGTADHAGPDHQDRTLAP